MTDVTAPASRPASASYLVPAVQHVQTSSLVSPQEAAQPFSLDEQGQAPQFSQNPAAQGSASYNAGASHAQNAPVPHPSLTLPHTSAPSQSQHLSPSFEMPVAADKAGGSVGRLPSNDGLQDKTALSQKCYSARSTNTLQTQLDSHAVKPQWMHALHAEPLPPWPPGPLPQGTFDLPQAPLGYSPAFSFGKQPCAVMW